MELKCCEWVMKKEGVEGLLKKRRGYPLSLLLKFNNKIFFLSFSLEWFSSFPQG
jgi:hypothetical protein